MDPDAQAAPVEVPGARIRGGTSKLPHRRHLGDRHIVEHADAQGPYGAKEAGEGPLHPIIPAIANAIYDACGARLYQLPMTPDRVLEGIRNADT